jgi:hypothetical protein
MKQIKVFGLVIFLLLSGLILRGQGWDKTYPYPIDPTFKLNFLAEAKAVAEAPNGDFVCFEATGSDLFLMRVNKEGGLIWRKNYPFLGNNGTGYTAFACLVDGSIIISGYGKIQAGVASSSYLSKYNENGDLLWSKFNSDNGDVVDMIATKDNGILMTKTVAGGTIKLSKFNSEGNFIWTYDYNYLISGYVGGITETEDGKIGLLYGSNPSKLEKLDANGRLIWRKTLDIPGTHFLFGNIVGTADSGIVYRAIVKPTISTYKNFLVKYDKLGNLVWSKASDRFDQTQYFKLAATPDNGVVVLSDRNTTKFNGSGAEVWNRDMKTSGGPSHYSMIKTKDDGFLIGGRYFDFVLARLIKMDSQGKVYSNLVTGKVVNINNCAAPDTAKTALKNWLVKVEKVNGDVFWDNTDSTGRYAIEMDSTGFDLSVQPISYAWKTCVPYIRVPTKPRDETTNLNYAVAKTGDFPAMFIDMSSFSMRRCANNYAQISYCNNGTTTAQNVRIEVKLDSLLEFVSSTLPLSSRNGQTLIFNLGNVPALECGKITIKTYVKCGDSTRIGQTLCSEARIFPDSLYGVTPNWSGANVIISGRCDRDSVRFIIKNTTGVPTSQLRSIVVEDEIVFINELRFLAPNASRTIALPANGHTWRLNQQQEPNNPNDLFLSTAVEGCRIGTNTFTMGLVNAFPNALGSPALVSTLCMPIVGSFDPNEKLAFPQGFKNEHFIEQNIPIDYQIGFQNTGTDTAFIVVLRDTLNDALDISTLKMGASSHTYTWDLIGKNTLRITFNNINLLDSFHNEAASHGFVKFKISQKKDVRIGTRIENQAAIYFDYNTPVFTNKTFHNVGSNLLRVSVESVFDKKTTIKVSPNPFSEQTTFELGPSVLGGIFELFDLNGRVLRREKFVDNHFSFERKDLPTGVFIFKIMTKEGQLIGNGKVVAQ